jgi:hypothetical protein
MEPQPEIPAPLVAMVATAAPVALAVRAAQVSPLASTPLVEMVATPVTAASAAAV